MAIFFILIVLVSITIHEYAHAWMAHILGDPTPHLSGRLTINPLAHIDPFGTIILPLLVLFVSVKSGQPFAIGYAKPVPINPYHFKNPKKATMWVGLAAPCTNLLIALFFSLVLKIKFLTPLSGFIIWTIIINLILAIFNLLPIPPLDGSRVIASLLPFRISYTYLKMEIWGISLILFLIVLGFFEWFLIPFTRIIMSWLGIQGVI